MERFFLLCFPPILTNFKSDRHCNFSHLAFSGLVPCNEISFSVQYSYFWAIWRLSWVDSSHALSSYPGGRYLIRESMKKRMVGDSAIDIMLASLSSNNFKQYDCCLRQWWLYCKLNNVDLFCASIPNVLRYLTKIFNKGKAYQTLNCHRSALSLILGNHLGTDDR